MSSHRKKILGYLLIMVGIALPLYGFTAISRNMLVDQKEYQTFISRELSREEKEVRQKVIERYNKRFSGKEVVIVDPFASDEYAVKYSTSKDLDEVFGYLRIPVLDLVQPIYLGASEDHLSKGTGHVDGTYLPIGGKNTRSVIAGHRGYFNAIIFLNIDVLEPGDQLFIENGFETLEYKVIEKEIIDTSQWEKLQPEVGKDLVTLLTCDPITPPRPNRLLIHCERVEEEQIVPEKQTNQEKPTKSEKKRVSVKPNQRMMITKYAVFVITILGWIALVFTAIRLIMFLGVSLKK